MKQIVTNLWFDTEAEEAAEFYTSIFPDSKIVSVTHYGEAGPRDAGMVLTVTFRMLGQDFIGLNGGPDFKFNEAISLLVDCDTQDEIDELWEKLTDGGEPGPCGWLKDRFGLSWQIVPNSLIEELMTDGDQAKADRVMQVILRSGKLDIAELQKAAAGN